MKHQFHFEKKFYQDKKSGYWISTTIPHIRAHVWVWKKYKGEIQKGFHIHHLDGNKSNNEIINLEMISCHDHISTYHNTEERKIANKIHAERIRPLTKKWHSSDEGLNWHKEHGIKTWNERKSFKINCLMCGCEIETKTYHQKFCHQNCKARHARRLFKSKIN
jgi:hypothetical protein